jgi:hypothetical protein
MGWKGNFVLVRDGEPADLAARLGGHLRSADLTFEDALEASPGPAVGPLLGGWRLVIDQHWQLASTPRLADLSERRHVVQYGVVEGVGFATASSWRDRSAEWSLTYQDGRLARHGDPPVVEVDGFDAVLAAVAEVTGWSYDLEEGAYQPIVGMPPEQPARRRGRRAGPSRPATPLIDEVDAGLAARLTALGFAQRKGREYDLELAPGLRGYVRIDVRTSMADQIESVTLSPRVGARHDPPRGPIRGRPAEPDVGWQWLTKLDQQGQVRPRPGVLTALRGNRGEDWRVFRPWPLPRRYRRQLRRNRWLDRSPYGPVDPILDDIAGEVARGGLTYLRRLAAEDGPPVPEPNSGS